MAEERIRAVFADAGAVGLLHAVPVGAGTTIPAGAGRTAPAGAGRADPGEPGTAGLTEPRAREVAVGADEPVVLASVFKVLLVLEFARQVAAGQLDPRERVRVTAADRLGGWGTAGCADDVELSLRDLAFFAMSVSDNSAADLLLDRVGLDTVRLLTQELGLTRTRVVGGPRDALESMLADVEACDEREFAVRYPPCRRTASGGWRSWTPCGPTPARPARRPNCCVSSGATRQPHRKPAPRYAT